MRVRRRRMWCLYRRYEIVTGAVQVKLERSGQEGWLPPPCFLQVLILKDFKERGFGQNPTERRVRPEVQIPEGLNRDASRSNKKRLQDAGATACHRVYFYRVLYLNG